LNLPDIDLRPDREVVVLLRLEPMPRPQYFSNLFSKGAVPAEGFWSFGDLTTAGPWMLGFLLGAFTIVGFESAANLAEETNDPRRNAPPRTPFVTQLAGPVIAPACPRPELSGTVVPEVSSSGQCSRLVDNS
jgi:hypothetical protein